MLCQQFVAITMFDERVGQRQHMHAPRVEPLLGGTFQECRPETAHPGTLFERDHKAAVGECAANHLAIDRLDESSVDDGNVEFKSA